MANFATYNDRRSAMRRLWTPLPDPDGTLDQADAQHVSWEYRGLLIDVTEPEVLPLRIEGAFSSLGQTEAVVTA